MEKQVEKKISKWLTDNHLTIPCECDPRQDRRCTRSGWVRCNKGQKSTVRDRGGMKTLACYHPFYDEEGHHHHHDGNTTTTGYSCSRGHEFHVSRRGTCWCGWNKDQTPHVVVSKGIDDLTE